MRSLKNASQRSHKICAGQTYIKFIKNFNGNSFAPQRSFSGGCESSVRKRLSDKTHPEHSMNFPLPYCEIAPRL